MSLFQIQLRFTSFEVNHCNIMNLYPWQRLKVIVICSFGQLTGIWGGGGKQTILPKISGTAGHMTMNLFIRYQLPEGGMKSKKVFDITHPVCKLWVCKIKVRLNSLFSGKSTSRHASFTKFCMIINTDVRNYP